MDAGFGSVHNMLVYKQVTYNSVPRSASASIYIDMYMVLVNVEKHVIGTNEDL